MKHDDLIKLRVPSSLKRELEAKAVKAGISVAELVRRQIEGEKKTKGKDKG